MITELNKDSSKTSDVKVSSFEVKEEKTDQ